MELRHVGVLIGAVGTVAVITGACTDNRHPLLGDDGGSGDDSGVVIGPPCTPPTAGTFPPSNCDPAMAGNRTCSSGGCPVMPPCSNSACMALATNTGNTLDFRIRRLNVVAPKTLATTFIEGTVVTPAIELPGLTTCGESGDPTKGGLFNWLIRVDKSANTITTGGAPKSADPLNTGYCFINGIVGGHEVTPINGPITFNGPAFTAAPSTGTLNIPIFLNASDPTQVVILPIQGGQFNDVTISPDGNCIGSFNASGADNMCGDDPTTCTKWNSAGSLGGFITIADADTVVVTLLSETLCVLLSSDIGYTNDAGVKHCPNDGSVKGDYCSTTHSAGGCQDSYWLASTFAASAVKIQSAPTDPLCLGNVGDAGSEAGADSGADAGSDGGSDAADAGGG